MHHTKADEGRLPTMLPRTSDTPTIPQHPTHSNSHSRNTRPHSKHYLCILDFKTCVCGQETTIRGLDQHHAVGATSKRARNAKKTSPATRRGGCESQSQNQSQLLRCLGLDQVPLVDQKTVVRF